MKKIFCLLVLVSVLTACGNKALYDESQQNLNHTENPITQASVTETPKSNARTYELTKIDYEMGLKCNICFYEGCIIYFLYVDDYTAMKFYKYDIEAGKTYELGRVENPHIDSGDIVEYEGKLYYYCNEKMSDSEDTINSLYQIDILNNTMIKIAEDCTYQTLLYVDILGNNLITLKGKKIDEKGITYLDMYDLSQIDKTDFKVLMEKESSFETITGEGLHHYSVDNGIIYALVEEMNAEGDSWRIEKYDEKGICFEKIDITKEEIVHFLNAAEIAEFEVMGNYIFIENMSGGGQLINISSEEMQIELQDEYDLEISIAVDKAHPSYAVMFQRYTGKLWELNIQEQELYEVKLPFEELRIIWIDKDGKAIVSMKDGYYKNY